MKLNIIIFIFLLLPLNCFAKKIRQFDFGDCSSNTLIVKASEALESGDLEAACAFADKCITLYSTQARRMQNKLKKIPGDNACLEFWALNHVAYFHYLKGEIYIKLNEPKKAYKEFKIPIKDYSFSKCFDPGKNSFWMISEQCKTKLMELENKFGKEMFRSDSSHIKMRPLPVLNKKRP